MRACRETQVNDVIGFAGRGGHARIVFDLEDPMGQSSCVGCGECVQACPTGALMPAGEAAATTAEKQVDSVCPYCGVGCQLTYHVAGNRILQVEGRDGPANHGRLCVKGRYGFDYVSHRHRLTRPLIRRDDAPKRAALDLDSENPLRDFREASWEEAMQRAADGLRTIRDERGPKALAGFGSAKGSNEEAYLFQKLVRTGFGSNNVDHCTRLCHASSVAALLQMIGSGAVSNPVADVSEAEVDPAHRLQPDREPPGGRDLHQERGARRQDADRDGPAPHGRSRDMPTHVLQFKPDTDVAHAQRHDARDHRRRAWSTRSSCATAPKATRR